MKGGAFDGDKFLASRSFPDNVRIRMKQLLQVLSPEARVYLEKHRVRKSYKRGETVYNMGEAPAGLYLIESGLVGLVFHSAKGSDHLLRLFKSGQVFAHRSYFAKEHHHAAAVAFEPTEASLIRHDAIEEIIRIDPEFLRYMIEFLAKELRSAELQRVLVSETGVLVRVAHAVAVMKDFDPTHRWTRSEIANFCASTTPTVVRALAELEFRGLIKQSGREIEVIDRDTLLHLEDEMT